MFLLKHLRLKLRPILGSLLLLLGILLLDSANIKPLEDIIERIEYIIYDQRINAFPVNLPDDQYKIMIVDIDEKSIQAEGRWPWSRSLIAQMVENLYQDGAAVIAFDMVFSEIEKDRLLETFKAFQNKMNLAEQDRKLLKQIIQTDDPNTRFAHSLQQGDSVLGYIFHNLNQPETGYIKPSNIILRNHHTHIPTLTHLTGNLQPFTKAASAAGFVTIFPDKDGVLRRAPLLLNYRNEVYGSLALETARQFNLQPNIAVHLVKQGQGSVVDHLKLADQTIFTDARGQVFIPYKGPEKSFPYLSGTEVLQKKYHKTLVEGSIILIGSSALGIGDLRTTPMKVGYPGVEVQANIILGLLTGQFPIQPSWTEGLNLIIMLVLGLLLSVTLALIRAVAILIVTITVIAAVTGLNLYLWVNFGFVLPLAKTLLTILCLSGFHLVYGYFIEGKNIRSLTQMFGQYVPAEHIKKMAENPNETFGFAGESREMTVLFCDIKNFTPLAEQMSANEIKSLLEAYLTPMTEIIFKHRGTIDKYVGDMIMAFWGAPLEDNQHANHAIAAALEMQNTLHHLNQLWQQQGQPSFEIGIGINTGLMNVGDMGSKFRRAYTVLGDAVNLASRLEAHTRQLNAPILIGEKSYQTQDQYICLLMGKVKVKGREAAAETAIYLPICHKDDFTEDLKHWKENHTLAIDCYLTGDHKTAQHMFSQLKETSPLPALYASNAYLKK